MLRALKALLNEGLSPAQKELLEDIRLHGSVDVDSHSWRRKRYNLQERRYDTVVYDHRVTCATFDALQRRGG